MTTISYKHTILLALLACSVLPSHALAARIYLDTPASSINVGDTIVVSVMVDSEQVAVNVVDGTIHLGTAASLMQVEDLSVAGSVSSLWSRRPSLSSDKKSISFVAGIPNGFNLPHAKLFDIVLLAKKTGAVTLDPGIPSIYKNDGKGTLVVATSSRLALVIHKAQRGVPPHNAWKTIISTDTTAPDPIRIAIGKDDSVFNGQQFIAFDTTDTGSGIDYFEVAEGNLPPVRSDNTYVLQNQNTSETITVIVHDKAGNSRTVVYHTPLPPGQNRGASLALIICLLSLGVAYWLYGVLKRRRQK